MERFEHGGNVYVHDGVLDYSANLNPLGIPASVKEALVRAVDSFDIYPDPSCTQLVSAIAEFENVDTDWIVPTAGATDAITRLCHAAALEHEDARALVCAPCYSGYEQALEQAGIPIERHELHEADGLHVTRRILDDITDEIGLVFLANPNNPTGLCLERDLLESVLARAEEIDAFVALDECFIDLTQQGGSNDLLERFSNLVIVKALTKTFALAGIRVGYALSSSAGMVELLRSLGQMWAVSTPAQTAGTVALREGEYVQQAQKLIAQERARLTAVLQNHGMHVVPGQSNYLMFKVPDETQSATDGSPLHQAPACQRLYEDLLTHGVLVRRCENYYGLHGQWYRIAVRSSEDNDRFIEAFEKVCS